MSPHVMVIEDEIDISRLVKDYLEKEGYRVTLLADGAQGMAEVLKVKPDLLLLDLMLPGMDGLEICKKVRSRPEVSHLPILMLTAKGEETDKIIGLELGADDYLTKPFSPKELVARVKALLRRTDRREPFQKRFSYGALSLDTERHDVTLQGKKIALTAKEFGLLQQLLENQGRVLRRETLLDRVWGYDADVTTRTVDVHIRRLREKIPLLADAILTVKSFGYKLQESEP